MGEIRIVGPGKTRGYPYPVCKKLGSLSSWCDRMARLTGLTMVKQAHSLNNLVCYHDNSLLAQNDFDSITTK